jgi:hydroxypyruvate reductase
MARSKQKLRTDAEMIFRAGLQAVDARKAVLRHLRIEGDTLHADEVALPLADFERVFVVGAGKAAAPMAAAVEQIIGDLLPLTGSINVKYGHTDPLPKRVTLVEAAHPTPDAAGVAGARKIEEILAQLTANDLLIVVISGGASALLPAPVRDITLEDKQLVTDLLLRAGADIQELNTVRKHLSSLKGGRLASRAGDTTVLALILSDVVGDPLDIIGSGPTVPDISTFAEAVAVLRKYSLLETVPYNTLSILLEGEKQEREAAPSKPSRQRVYNLIVGSNELALEAARTAAETLGYDTKIFTSTMRGESRQMASEYVRMMLRGLADTQPACLLAGGETTVTVRGTGKGGRNQELALAASVAMSGMEGAVLLSAGTDGTDGPTDAAGAVVDGESLTRAETAGFNVETTLANNDSYPLLDATGDLLRIGPTGTNVMDIVVMLVDSSGS